MLIYHESSIYIYNQVAGESFYKGCCFSLIKYHRTITESRVNWPQLFDFNLFCTCELELGPVQMDNVEF